MSDVSQGPGWWLAADGKWYAPQPQSQPAYQAQPAYQPQAPPARKGHGCLYALLGAFALAVIVVVIVVVALAVTASKVSHTVASGGLGGPAPAAQYSLGQTASSGGMSFKVYALTDPYTPTNPAFAARAGDHFVTVDVQVTNPGTGQQTFSSLLGFHLLDAQNRQYAETLVAALSPSAPEGQIAGGQSVRGFVAFEIPDGTTGLKFRAQGSLTAAGAVWTLS